MVTYNFVDGLLRFRVYILMYRHGKDECLEDDLCLQCHVMACISQVGWRIACID